MCCPRFVTTLHRRNLLSTDDWRTFSEVFPLFDPVFVFCTCPVGGKRGVLVAEGRALLTSRVSCVPALATCGQQTTSRLRSTKIWRRFRLVSWIETCRYRAVVLHCVTISGQAACHSGVICHFLSFDHHPCRTLWQDFANTAPHTESQIAPHFHTPHSFSVVRRALLWLRTVLRWPGCACVAVGCWLAEVADPLTTILMFVGQTFNHEDCARPCCHDGRRCWHGQCCEPAGLLWPSPP